MLKFQKYSIFLIIVSLLICVMPSFALNFDVSVDDEIRKNYNPSKLELENLPPLPNVKPAGNKTNYGSTKPVNNLPTLSAPSQKPIISAIDRSTAVKLRSGTKFTVRSSQGISDSLRVGTRLSFVTQRAVNQTFVTIPQGTVFHGEVADSHTPQVSGNGGLLVLQIDSMNYQGRNIGVNAKITKANHKNIYVNNIKGKRQYWRNVARQVDKGDRFYKKTRRASAKLSGNPFGTIISPIPTIVGMGAYAINFVGSPLIGFFGTGGKISIPAGSEFEIKLLEDAYLPH